ncbi:hypothetical protein MUN88_15300 [Gracilibacillus caseinilyticus]|uniref:Uncharacterized protein n=1 Tax=Gracilibacillus caseinilyticus TaxID=2932256 RepID=A0ABY4ESL9_9BACI|nr:hypothetical protein [Gracilibacillus caseinilyticus]UOQ47425.1 hypothetical protein MUN88_15300 [Gracilibacillus caseinilyticus]
MNQSRKQIIVNEIHYWKSHKLLPDHYCDFLLALYTEGHGDGENQKLKKQSAYMLLYYFFDSILILLPILVFLATDELFIRMIGIVIICTLALLMKKQFFRYPELKSAYAVMIFFVVCLFSSLLILDEYVGNSWMTYSWMLLNSLTWIIIGKRKQQHFLQIAGIFVLIIICIMLGFNFL